MNDLPQLMPAAAQKILALCLGRIDPAQLEGINLPRLCEILAAAGLRVVDETAVEVKPEVFQAIVTIAAAAVRDPEILHRVVSEY